MKTAEDTPLQFTKREMQRAVRDIRVWIGLLAAGGIIGLMGPFGTDEHMRLVPRQLYWMAVVAVSYLSGSAAASFVVGWNRRAGGPWPLALALAGLAAGVLVLFEVSVLNWLLFGAHPGRMTYLAPLAANVLAISMIVTIAGYLLDRHAAVRDPVENAPRIISRLAFGNRGQLVSMHVQDHYVDVHTTAGHEMILIRFSDAMAEASPAHGLQVHRSHWVGLEHVSQVTRDGAKAVVTLTDGREVPVSRTYVPALKEAGLLPQ